MMTKFDGETKYAYTIILQLLSSWYNPITFLILNPDTQSLIVKDEKCNMNVSTFKFPLFTALEK